MSKEEIEARVLEGGIDQLGPTDHRAVIGLPRQVPLLESFRGLAHLLSHSLTYWPSILLAAVFMIGFSLTSSVSVLMFAPLLTLILQQSGSGAMPPAAMASEAGSLIDLNSFGTRMLDALRAHVSSPTPMRLMVVLCTIMFGVVLLRSLCMFLGKNIAWNVQIKTFYKLQRDVFENTLFQDMRFFHKNRVGALISEIQSNIMAITMPIQEIVAVFLGQPLLLLFYFVLMVKTSLSLTLVALCSAAVSGLIAHQIGNHLRRLKRSQLTQTAFVSALMQEAFNGIRIVKAFAAEPYESRRYASKTMDYLQLERKHMAAKLAIDPLNAIFGTLALSIVFVWGGSLVVQGKMSFTGLLMFLVITRQAMSPLNAIMNTVSMVFSVLGASERVYELLTEKPHVLTGSTEAKPIQSSITFEHVSFNYGDGEVLKDINLTVKTGETVALVGPSGSGKSTFADLLLRFYDPTSGSISVDGQNIKSFTLASYRKLFGIVPQETILFNDTVRNNIRYAREAISDEDVIQAAKIANAHDFIQRMPKGYDTYIGDRGTRLSGGERQRLAIARAVLTQPSLLIFDEATSSLDNESEKLLQRAVDQVVQGRTAIIIAHRLSTIRNADRILVLQNGVIVEEGNHESLLQTGGLYKRLHEMALAHES